MADNVNTATMDVLLVEDSPGDVNLARESFRAVDVPISLHLAGSGEEALAYLRREGLYRNARRPDIILLDLNLPRMSGREVLVQIKSDDSCEPFRRSFCHPPKLSRTFNIAIDTMQVA